MDIWFSFCAADANVDAEKKIEKNIIMKYTIRFSKKL